MYFCLRLCAAARHQRRWQSAGLPLRSCAHRVGRISGDPRLQQQPEAVGVRRRRGGSLAEARGRLAAGQPARGAVGDEAAQLPPVSGAHGCEQRIRLGRGGGRIVGIVGSVRRTRRGIERCSVGYLGAGSGPGPIGYAGTGRRARVTRGGERSPSQWVPSCTSRAYLSPPLSAAGTTWRARRGTYLRCRIRVREGRRPCLGTRGSPCAERSARTS